MSEDNPYLIFQSNGGESMVAKMKGEEHRVSTMVYASMIEAPSIALVIMAAAIQYMVEKKIPTEEIISQHLGKKKR